MIEIEELNEADLERWLGVSNAVRPSDPLTPAMMIDWCSQAESMVWLLATVDGADAAVGHGIIGWHAEPDVCQLEVSVLEERRGQGLGVAVLGSLSGWALAGGQTAADGTIDERDETSLAWAERRGFTEVGRN